MKKTYSISNHNILDKILKWIPHTGTVKSKKNREGLFFASFASWIISRKIYPKTALLWAAISQTFNLAKNLRVKDSRIFSLAILSDFTVVLTVISGTININVNDNKRSQSLLLALILPESWLIKCCSIYD